uniref:AAA family ATPase n=1 Tax=candidate division WOR-3 bacterium TaxID=2052148 RepID=A0A7C4THL8_UNCW3
MKIIFRDIIDDLRRFLNSDDILLLTGARQAGKTSILRFLQEELNEKKARTFFLNLEDPDYLRLINQSPKNLFKIFPISLKEKTFVFIDEVQYLKNPTNFLKYFYDEYQGKIKIIASGSSAFYLDKKFKDSLVGRKLIFPVRTLSFREFLR